MVMFKDQIPSSRNSATYPELTARLAAALSAGEQTLKKLLFDTEELTPYYGTYSRGQHKGCGGCPTNTFTEPRLCRCLYYRHSAYPSPCEQCAFEQRFDLVGDCRITDYQVPAYYCGKGIGAIDLIICKEGIEYATEVKPYKNNNETLLRMIAEILTYTAGDQAVTYQKAIAFFEKNREDGSPTAQQIEYENASALLLHILDRANISVFRFEQAGENSYQLCKL